MKTICTELATVQHKWFKIGVYTGIPYDILQDFQQEDDPLAAVMDYVLRGNVKKSLSLKSIVMALKSKHIGETELADTINGKYLHQESTEEHITKMGTMREDGKSQSVLKFNGS